MRLLLVEDEPFIALDLELLSLSAGHEVIGIADSFQSAIDLAESGAPQAALVDVNLRDGFTGLRIARALSDRGLAIAFITGNPEQIPPDFAGALAVLAKPFAQEGIEEILAILGAAVNGGPASGSEPRHARLARRGYLG